MRIYVDFDDCLCETGRAFPKLALEMFSRHVARQSGEMGCILSKQKQNR